MCRSRAEASLKEGGCIRQAARFFRLFEACQVFSRADARRQPLFAGGGEEKSAETAADSGFALCAAASPGKAFFRQKPPECPQNGHSGGS